MARNSRWNTPEDNEHWSDSVGRRLASALPDAADIIRSTCHFLENLPGSLRYEGRKLGEELRQKLELISNLVKEEPEHDVDSEGQDGGEVEKLNIDDFAGRRSDPSEEFHRPASGVLSGHKRGSGQE